MISPRSAVVVVFPFVPVIARTVPAPMQYASSTSPQIGSPAAFKRSTGSISSGTPGLITTRLRLSISSCFNSPSTISHLLSFGSFALISSFFNDSFPSYNTTSACTVSNSFTAPIPLIPEPKTNTFFPCNSVFFIISFLSFYTPKSAIIHKIAVTIENTATTLVSDHPHSSK